MSLSRLLEKVSYSDARRGRSVDGLQPEGKPSSVSNTMPPAIRSPDASQRSEPFATILERTWEEVKDGTARNTKEKKVRDDIEDRLDEAQEEAAAYGSLLPPTGDAIDQGIAKAVQEGIDQFFEGMPVFMKALDAVAELHPFIGAAVMAFKTVYTLELKRRDNEKKIIALYLEMKDMMAVLLQLQNVRDEEVIAPDHLSIEDRMRSLIEKTVSDIKECSNTCDTYCKKNLLARVVQGPIWDARLLAFITTFVKRRAEFEFALAIHTAQSMDTATTKLGMVYDKAKEIDSKIDIMMAVFQKLVSREHQAVLDIVDAKGGIVVVRDDDELRQEVDAQAAKAIGRESLRSPTYGFDELKDELSDDPDTAIQKNMAPFSRKFEVQKRQIVDALTLVVRRESDRIIEEVKRGAHDRILDKAIHEIWKEMGWRGNVKARHFVLALRDYYTELLNWNDHGLRGLKPVATEHQGDGWAIKYIDIAQLQPIMEAFDDDASGFITVSEMNRFTSSRPLDWSLPHWVAFWAIGWRSSIIDYAKKIEDIVAKMEGIHADMLPPNRLGFDAYFHNVWSIVHALTAPLLDQSAGPNQEKFTKYVDAEEARLKENLNAIDYLIDERDTLPLITGAGRPEKTVFPLIYLLMKRHYKIMKVARVKVIAPVELFEAASAILFVNEVIQDRVRDLNNIFVQKNLDPDVRFKSFAHGIFQYFHRPTDLWTTEYMKNLVPKIIPFNESEEEDIRAEDVLKYDYKDNLTIDDWVYDRDTIHRVPDNTDIDLPLKNIMGQWNGRFYFRSGTRAAGGDSMFTVILEPAEGQQDLQGVGWSNRGRFTVTGTWRTNTEDVTKISLRFSFGLLWRKVYAEGEFDPQNSAVLGMCGLSADSSTWSNQFMFRKIPPHYFAYYPDMQTLKTSKARALWHFAIESVLQDIRRQRWSWSFFAQRRKDRCAYIQLYLRWMFYGPPLSDDDVARLTQIGSRLLPVDACFYTSRVHYIRATTAVHENVLCDNCDGTIGGPRNICLDCTVKSEHMAWDSVDLCNEVKCITSVVTLDARPDLVAPHQADHHLVKVRTVISVRQVWRVQKEAHAALKKVEDICAKLASQKATTSEMGPIMGFAPQTIATVSDRPPVLPVCGVCKCSLTLPCWYCVKCDDRMLGT
ncbi:hypothetical protein BV25DRAFT_1864510 [Artomyces pyxidatus]|uniref:Uncharacterized protein n=1 Tax=Artomyces pyxidatus TaxID=48021 RepID=A0ACB8SK78_9AGAM|nr:hypothetical protein BV25DRAFT_1864510 [Artomyces pyxidatus]